jgi:hypothetical protein
MPVSNPSYFPDQRGNGSIVGITAGPLSTSSNSFLAGTNAGKASTANDLIIIGNGSGSGGITDPNLAGTIIIGVDSAPFIETSAASAFPLTLVGYNSLALINSGGATTTHVDSTVVMGSSILNGPQWVGGNTNVTGSVFIGNDLFNATTITGGTGINDTVVIGFNIGNGGAAAAGSIPQSAVMIGANQFATTHNSPYAGVYVGVNIDCTQPTGAILGPNVVIGNSVTLSGTAEACVIIGDGTFYQGNPVAASFANVCVGTGIIYNGNNNTVIGPNAKAPNPTVGGPGFGNVIIGSYAGTSIPNDADVNNLLLIESNSAVSGDIPAALLYGFFSGAGITGSLILGNSVQGVNRDIQGTNTVKLLNGTVGSAPPVGGGYFYVTAGALHWVGSGGTDTAIAPA